MKKKVNWLKIFLCGLLLVACGYVIPVTATTGTDYVDIGERCYSVRFFEKIDGVFQEIIWDNITECIFVREVGYQSDNFEGRGWSIDSQGNVNYVFSSSRKVVVDGRVGFERTSYGSLGKTGQIMDTIRSTSDPYALWKGEGGEIPASDIPLHYKGKVVLFPDSNGNLSGTITTEGSYMSDKGVEFYSAFNYWEIGIMTQIPCEWVNR